MKITVGEERIPSLDPGRLDPQELTQLGQLLEGRARLQAQLELLEQKLHLMLLAAKERRGITGTVSVDCVTGVITAENASQEE